jgi:hypothetical protein
MGQKEAYGAAPDLPRSSRLPRLATMPPMSLMLQGMIMAMEVLASLPN